MATGSPPQAQIPAVGCAELWQRLPRPPPRQLERLARDFESDVRWSITFKGNTRAKVLTHLTDASLGLTNPRVDPLSPLHERPQHQPGPHPGRRTRTRTANQGGRTPNPNQLEQNPTKRDQRGTIRYIPSLDVTTGGSVAASRLLAEHRGEHRSEWVAICSIVESSAVRRRRYVCGCGGLSRTRVWGLG